MAEFTELARIPAVPNSRDGLLHLETSTPQGPRRRCHPAFAAAGSFAQGVSDFLIKLTDPQLRGPAAHWEGICRACRATLGLDDLLRARQAHIDSPECRHGVSLGEDCPACNVALRSYNDLGNEDVPIEGWQVLPFGKATTIAAGGEVVLTARPQLIMRGPYRMRLHVEPPPAACRGYGELGDRIYVEGIQIGNVQLAYAWGDIWGWSFEDVNSNKPVFDRLLPLAGPVLNLGNNLMVTLRNENAIAAKVSIVLFGHGMDERHFRERATGDPSTRAGARRLREADPGRPPQLPAHVSVRPHDPVFAGDMDDEFWDLCDGDYIGDRIAGRGEADGRQRMLAALALPAYAPGVPYRNPLSGPVGEQRESSPLEVLLELGDEHGAHEFTLRLKRGAPRTYQGRGQEFEAIAKAAAIVRKLAVHWQNPEAFEPPRFTVAGVDFEVRLYEPLPPAPPPKLSEQELRAREAQARDSAATAVYLINQANPEEPEETAWESPTDEWP